MILKPVGAGNRYNSADSPLLRVPSAYYLLLQHLAEFCPTEKLLLSVAPSAVLLCGAKGKTMRQGNKNRSVRENKTTY